MKIDLSNKPQSLPARSGRVRVFGVGFDIPADMIHYGFTKTANLSISRGLAKRLAGTGVTVNAVLPGPSLTEGVKAMP